MKKILALIICLIMIISSCLLTGCFDDIDDSTSNATSESTSENADANKVSLLGIQASVNEDKSLQQSIKKSPAASLLSTYTTTPEIQTMSNTHSGDELLENDGGYLSIFKSQTIINFTIKLNNPYDYYILDFRLGADDEEVEYYTSEKTWKSIADRDIRWMGSDNATCTYILRLSSPDATPSKIRIKWMYYTDKHDGRNRFAVNMNNKDKYTIYKFDESIKDESVKVNIIKNPLDGKDDNGKKSPIEFNMTLKDGVAIDKVYFWNYSEEKYEIIEKSENNTYKNWGYYVVFIDYSYTTGKITIHATRKLHMDYFTIGYGGAPEYGIKEYEEFGNKKYFYIHLFLQGSGCFYWWRDENPTYSEDLLIQNYIYKDNNFIMYWENQLSRYAYLLLEVPEGKDEAWCREQEFEIFGNVLNIGRLADGKYGEFAIARD